jgi:hypothetical protein
MAFSPKGLLEVPHGVQVQTMPDPGLAPLQAHRKVDQPLFDHAPCMEDVRQGEIGDCYLLGAINAIMRQPEGSDVIQHLMHDDGNGMVTVRLFKDAGYHYVRLRKTVVHEYRGSFLGKRYGTGRVLHNQGAVWVSLLEKAYLGFILADQSKSYKGIEGGGGRDAMKAFLGPGMASPTASGNPESGVDAGVDAAVRAGETFAMLVNDLSADNKLAARFPAIKKKIFDAIDAAIFPDDAGSSAHSTLWFDWNRTEKQNAFTAFTQGAPTHAGFDALLARVAGDLDRETRELVRIWAHSQELWPGAMGSAKYTPLQLNVFAKIQRALATNRAVTIGTKKVLQGPSSGAGRSAGEAKVAGIAAGHEYSVLDTKIDGVGRRFVLLRNPWGEYGRSYQSNIRRSDQKGPATLTPVAVEAQAESWIELTDLTTNFGAVDYGGQVAGAARQAFMHGLDAQLQAQRAKLRPTRP